MIIYHGSREIIQKPTYGFGSKFNDYGLGFYCTENIELAKEWACPISNDGFVNEYELNTDTLNIMYLNSPQYNILNWMALLLNNRIFSKRTPISRQANDYILKEFLPNITNYDVIIGYRADDSYFSYANDFLNNGITINQLKHALYLGELGEQIVLISKNAFNNISYLGYYITQGNIYYAKRAEREHNARIAYLDNHGADFLTTQNDLFIMDILREKVKNDDPRIQ